MQNNNTKPKDFFAGARKIGDKTVSWYYNTKQKKYIKVVRSTKNLDEWKRAHQTTPKQTATKQTKPKKTAAKKADRKELENRLGV